MRYLLLLLLTPITFAEVDIKTLANWNINDFDETSLIVAKSSSSGNERKAILGFVVQRPHCFATHPILMIRTPIGTYSDGDIVFGELKVDKNRAEQLKMERELGFEDEGLEINWFRLKRFPAINNAKRVEIIFKSTTPIEDIVFITEGIQLAVYQSEQICGSPYEFTDADYSDIKI